MNLHPYDTERHNTESLKVIIIGAMKIYVTSVEALMKKERKDETQFTIKIGGKTSLGPKYFVL
jgi:hypothetical protein